MINELKRKEPKTKTEKRHASISGYKI